MRLDVVATRYDASGLPPLGPVPDVVKVLNYRKDVFGRPFSHALEDVMRGPSAWSVAERELFAAFVSRRNECPYCTGVHGATASLAMTGGSVVQAALENPGTPGISEPVRATLELLAKLTLDPEHLGPEDIDAVRRRGVTDEALADAISVCALFCMINRCANALGFELLDDYTPSAHHLLELGYLPTVEGIELEQQH